MGKRPRDHTPTPPLDDDANWVPIEPAHERQAERTGDGHLAALDLMKLLKQGRLPCMARSIATGERKLVAPAEWDDQIELRFWKNRPSVFLRRPSVRIYGRRRRTVLEQVRDRVFYLSRPHLDRLSPPLATSAAPVEHEDASNAPPLKRDGWQVARVKKLFSIIYPDGVPTDATDKEVLEPLAPEFVKRGWKPPGTDTIARARGRR